MCLLWMMIQNQLDSANLGQLSQLAAEQAGVVSASQANSIDVKQRTLHRAARNGVLTQMYPGVFRFVSAPANKPSLLWAGYLRAAHGGSQSEGTPDSDSGAQQPVVLSHESALWLQGVDRMPFAPAVTIGRHRNNRHGNLRVHRLNDLRPSHRSTELGLPTTTIERAIVDVTSQFGRARMEYLIDYLTITTRATNIAALSCALGQINRRGRKGIGKLGPMLDARSVGGPAPRSRLEVEMNQLLSRSQLPAAVREMPIPSLTERPGLVDCAWPTAGLILEIDGRTWHSREQAMAVDRARDRDAAAAGWQTVRVLDAEITTAPDQVVNSLEAIHAQRMQSGRIAA